MYNEKTIFDCIVYPSWAKIFVKRACYILTCREKLSTHSRQSFVFFLSFTAKELVRGTAKWKRKWKMIQRKQNRKVQNSVIRLDWRNDETFVSSKVNIVLTDHVTIVCARITFNLYLSLTICLYFINPWNTCVFFIMLTLPVNATLPTHFTCFSQYLHLASSVSAVPMSVRFY